MTQAPYARHRNKSRQDIANLVKAGILVKRVRMVDGAASDAVLDHKPAERTVPSRQPPSNYAEAKLVGLLFHAAMRVERPRLGRDGVTGPARVTVVMGFVQDFLHAARTRETFEKKPSQDRRRWCPFCEPHPGKRMARWAQPLHRKTG